MAKLFQNNITNFKIVDDVLNWNLQHVAECDENEETKTTKKSKSYERKLKGIKKRLSKRCHHQLESKKEAEEAANLISGRGRSLISHRHESSRKASTSGKSRALISQSLESSRIDSRN